ncbi:MAG: bifunctional UDP-N-acetylglucosamine diphosphorylase/glucosamine-1-phosphate N-acetyltransferase GlmU [Magnetococcales bacterium]|nr:bifunctional UDP-N-acetylglucosamine diphosphorylase/glucosamine-1-phosphate N-acetyltransferase GlmU [Magnetococcales bacterium]
MPSLAVLVLAAGQGTRMRSHLPKVLHELAGWPLLQHVLHAVAPLNPERIVIVVGHKAELVEAALDSADIVWVKQPEQKGTGHAVLCALPALEGFEGDLLILNGDTPLVESETLRTFIGHHRREERGLSVLSMTMDPPTGYGRVVRDAAGGLLEVVEEKDADSRTQKITEVNSGMYCVSTQHISQWLGQVTNDNAQGEYYLPDIIPMAVAAGVGAAYHHKDSLSLAGVNNRMQLSRLEKVFRDRKVEQLMASGVTFIDPDSCWLAPDVEVGQDTVIFPHVLLGVGVSIGEGCRVGPFCEISRSRLGEGSVVRAFCHLDGATSMGPNEIGPYARLRVGSHLAPKAKVGNFCELKKAIIGEGSKVNHLSYVGDTVMGANVNVGAGTITCNYDGVNKHKTTIGDGVFIGSGTQLVAPVTLADGVVIGAGSAITKSVAADSLALTRAPQRVVPSWSTHKKKPA